MNPIIVFGVLVVLFGMYCFFILEQKIMTRGEDLLRRTRERPSLDEELSKNLEAVMLQSIHFNQKFKYFHLAIIALGVWMIIHGLNS